MRIIYFLIIVCFLIRCNEKKFDTKPISKKNAKKEIVLKAKETPFKLSDENVMDFFLEYDKYNKENKVRVYTSFGEIDIMLFNNTKFHRSNFIYLTKKKYFNGTQFYRIINNFNAVTLNEYHNYYEYPSIESSRFKINDKFDISIIERIINTEDILGKPLYCYDFKGLCSSSLRLECISKINKKNGYIYIIPDKEKCASLIDKYLWY